MREKYKDEEWLQAKYVNERLSVEKMADGQKVTPSTIYYWLGKFDIDIIDRSADKVKTHCDNCGKEIYKFEREIREHTFCSKECNNKWISDNKNTEICAWCGKEFSVPPKEVKENNFCCHEHYAKWLEGRYTGEDHPNYSLIDVRCTQCGEKFKVPEWRKGQNDKSFCNYECYGKWLSENNSGNNHPRWNGGDINYYGPNWESQRKKVLKRDNCKCQKCGRKKDNAKLDIHHIIPFKEYRLPLFSGVPIRNVLAEFNWERANKLENLITLCASCHQKAEGKDINDFFNE